MDGDHVAIDIGGPPSEISVPHHFFITFPPNFKTWLAQVLDGDDNDKFHKILDFFDFINEFCTKETCSLNPFLPVRICDDQSWLRSEIILGSPQAESLGNSATTLSNVLPRQASLKKLLTSVAKSGRAVSLGMPWRILTNIAGSVHRTPVLNALEDGDPRGTPMFSEGSKKELQKTCKANVKLPVIPLPEFWSKGSVIGKGSTGEVRQVTISQSVFAMKIFNGRESWRAEADIVGVLSHPHIVHTFGSTESNDPNEQFSLLMERMKDDLSGWITSNGLFKPLDSLDVLLQLAQAMEYLHGEQVVHGDLKCGNILISQFDISRDAEQFIVVKVADFGNAQRANSNPFIPTKGTTKWSAPEVLRWHKSMEKLEDPFKADVYSFGLIAYEVLTGLLIFDGASNLSELKEKIMGSDLSLSHYFTQFDDEKTNYSESFISFMKRCWAFEPTERPSFHKIIEKIKETKTSMISKSQEPYDKIEINEEAKKDSMITQSQEPHVCAPAIDNPNLRPETKCSKSKLGIRATMNAFKKVKKAPGAMKKFGKKQMNAFKELCEPKNTTNQVPLAPTQPISFSGVPVESWKLDDKIEINEKNEEAKKDSMITQSQEPHVCAPAIDNPNLRPETNCSKSKLGIRATMNAFKKVKKAPGAMKKFGKKQMNAFKELCEPKNTTNQVPLAPTQPISFSGVPVESWAQEGNERRKRKIEDDASKDGYGQVIKSNKKGRL